MAWSSEGKELFYVPKIFGFEAVSVATQPTFAFGNAVAVPRPFLVDPPNARTLYDIAPGGRFVGLISPAQIDVRAMTTQIHVIVNWFEELRARVPAAK